MSAEPPHISRKEAIALGLTRYYNGRKCKHGHRSERQVSNMNCLACQTERVKLYSTTPARRLWKRQYEKHRYESTQQMNIFKNCKNRATRRGLPFDITPEDIVIPEVCPVLGIKLHLGSKGFDPNSPSVDRVDGNKGYVKGNVRIISMRANKLKSDATLEELEAVVAYYRRESAK